MNILELLKRATPAPVPLLVGEWATLLFRPDLGSQQEFIVGVAITTPGEAPRFKWLPSLSKLSSLYGESVASNEAMSLLRDSERWVVTSFKDSLRRVDTGTPHIRLNWCGHLSTDDLDQELTLLLKRQSGALWAEREPRGDTMNDDWAYAQMLLALTNANLKRDVFVRGRTTVINGKSIKVGLDNGRAFGNIVSARYGHFHTVERHIFRALQQVVSAHKLSARADQPALFVVLPEEGSALQQTLTKKSTELLSEVEEMGIMQYCDPEPAKVAGKIQVWAEA